MSTFLYRILAITSVAFITSGCNKQLIEDPKSSLTPEYFKTAQGFQSGLDAAYAGNRNLWGSENLMTMTVPGTDEFKSGGGGNSNFNVYSSSYDASSGFLSGVWNPCYTFINTCNGIIDNGATVTGLDANTVKQKVAEAKFLRANYYFLLVRFFGPVTLNKNFISEPSTSADRAPIADIYSFIVQDLKEAIASLPSSPTLNGVLPGKATAAAASHLLAKVYLTRAYSSAKQPDDFQNAYNTARGLIDNLATLNLGLLPDFGSVFAEGNEASREVLWSVQHTSNLTYNGISNELNFHYVMGYENFPGLVRSMAYGRPYGRVQLTSWLSNVCFADKTNDTRYYKTFQSVWLSNSADKIPKVNGVPKYALGDTAIYMPGFDVTNAKVSASRYLLVPPRNYTLQLYPTMTKYQDTKRAGINDPSVRPIIVYRLAETYLLAAEAAINLGDNTNAAKYINVVRARAAYPTGNTVAMNVTPAQITLDYILDERARELCGEQTRWLDLVSANKLVERVKLYNPDAAPNIQDKHVLRPIPQSQIDRIITGDKYPQNTGF
ncbi:putative outer membrane protein [Pedobacter sp. BAL39]|uniref:RagB/SusD family nutrient uptake outer membrane protein n=1 Tax=Pedobacter sp. BAL39 TaxID=391596 RepID=UPI00015592A3|nr:RagB/SusD family nutrient uptake outer membrane protein [Pedobacter sp. BAL39]EDM37628.1 putative outer membrane protein [Pedobacter sp. BAL39]